MRVRFWGVRGSLPMPGPNTIRYGGNTSCVDILTSDKQVIILDAGTGIRPLGKKLQEEYPQPERVMGTVFFSHTHWDHIQGFPFFMPAFVRNNRFVIVGQKRIDQKLDDVLRGQVVEPYLPFDFGQFAADIVIKEIDDGEVMIVGDETEVQARALDHPGGCLGFRIQNNDAVLAYCTDTGHPNGSFNENVLKLAHNANVLIHDGQFSLEQRKLFPSWGHSSWLEAAQVAVEANVHRLVLFHHDPDIGDDDLEVVLEKAQRIFPNTILAYESLTLYLPLV